MLRSMTGYGSATMGGPLGEFSVEIKSLNSRFLDLSMKLPRELSFAELSLRDEVKRTIRRGKVDLFMRWLPPAALVEATEIQPEVLRRYSAQVRDALGDEAAIHAAGALLGLPGVLAAARSAADGDALLEAALEATGEAVRALDVSRASEGRVLAEAVAAHLDALTRHRDEIAEEKDAIAAAFEDRLRQRIEEAARRVDAMPDTARLEQELVLHADRSDITEEIVRLEGHLAAFRRLLEPALKEPAGKTMDFLTQELLRETNTIGSKSRGLAVAARVVEMKAEIEKLREQVQNIE